VRTHVLRRADAGAAASVDVGSHDLFGAVPALLQVLAPQVGASRHRVVRDERVQRIAEELEPFVPAADRFGPVAMNRERRHHREVRVDAVAERHALLRANDVVVDRRPGAGLLRVEEREGERSDSERRRDLDRVAVRARHPHRRMRLLHGLGQHVAAGHREVLALEPGIRLEDHHVGDLLGGLERHRALFLRLDGESAEFQPRCAFADPEVDAAVRNDVERRKALRSARRVVVIRNDLPDPVRKANAFRPGSSRREEHFRRRRMRVLVEEMVLDFPRVVVAETVGERDLLERLVEQAPLVVRRPRPGELHLVEDAESHRSRR
jgi:hypothetical protein